MAEIATAEQVDRYTNGDCLYLAQAIADATGWQLVGILDCWSVQGADYCSGHIAVIHPDGDLIDVTGRTSPDELSDWGGELVTLDHIADLKGLGWGWVAGWIDDDTRELAAEIVSAL